MLVTNVLLTTVVIWWIWTCSVIFTYVVFLQLCTLVGWWRDFLNYSFLCSESKTQVVNRDALRQCERMTCSVRDTPSQHFWRMPFGRTHLMDIGAQLLALLTVHFWFGLWAKEPYLCACLWEVARRSLRHDMEILEWRGEVLCTLGRFGLQVFLTPDTVIR